jgi:CheY-like chemotaxis protein
MVFLSYSSEDAVFAELVKMKLGAAKIEVWLDQDKLDAGEEWRNEIDLGINDAKAFVLILTPKSCKSEYVTYEWAYALGRKKNIIPLMYKKSKIHPRLSGMQYLDFTDNGKGPWDKLLNRIGDIVTANPEEENKQLVGNMTKDELLQLISGSLQLANASAKSMNRERSESDVQEAIGNLTEVSSKLKTSKPSNNLILWVDDNPNNNNYERNTLETLGFEIELALSTKEAIQKIKTKTYAVIISDRGRKEGKEAGFDLLKIIREEDKVIPYFFYTATSAPEVKELALKQGAQGLTNKPAELVEMVTGYISMR